MNAFLPADILFPKVDSMEKWAVIACDQFTSDPAYWERVRKNAEGAPSTINLILPEAELGTPQEAVTPSKQTNLRRAALQWLERNGQLLRHNGMRFDVVTVRVHDGQVAVHRIPGAF